MTITAVAFPEAPVSALNSPTALARAEHAERELRVVTLQNRALVREAQGTAQTRRIAFLSPDAVLAPTIRIAAHMEAVGAVPVIRWARDASNRIIGLEFSRVIPADAPVTEMAVVGADDDDIGPRGVTT